MHRNSHGYLKSAAISQLLHKQIDVWQAGNSAGRGTDITGNLHAHKPLPASAQPP